jgi:hypothetical protein
MGNFKSTCTKPKELAYWRKHPNLHGWMERLWEEQGRPGAESPTEMFNGIEVELTWTDIENLEADILKITYQALQDSSLVMTVMSIINSRILSLSNRPKRTCS